MIVNRKIRLSWFLRRFLYPGQIGIWRCWVFVEEGKPEKNPHIAPSRGEAIALTTGSPYFPYDRMSIEIQWNTPSLVTDLHLALDVHDTFFLALYNFIISSIV